MRLPGRLRVSVVLFYPLAGLLAATALAARPAEASPPWSDPVVLVSTAGYVSRPTLVADSQGDVHLVLMHNEASTADQRGALMYARFHQGRWSASVDVLVSPDGARVTAPAMVLDSQGFLHVVAQGGAANYLYYSRTHASQAGSPRAWSEPIRLSASRVASGGFGGAAAIAVSDDQTLHVVYATHDGSVTYRRSTDAGQSWMREVNVYAAGASSMSMPDTPRILADGRGRLHVTWTQFQLPGGWPPVGTFSARSVNGGESWSEPLRVAAENYGLLNMAAQGPDLLHRVWHGTVSSNAERRHQWSSDGGQTWAAPWLISSDLKGGFTGYSPMAVDSAGTLHLVTSVSGRSDTTEDIYHAAWNGTTWSRPDLISAAVVGKVSVEQPSIAISGGNHLHAVWEDDFQRIWYTSRLVDAPALPLRQLPPPPVAPGPLPIQSVVLPTATREALPAFAAGSSHSIQSTAEPVPPLIAGAMPSLLLLAAVVAFRVVRRSSY